MAKKKNQNSKASRDSNIGSSSLLPARSHGEMPDMAFPIKREPIENYDSVPMEIDFPVNNPEVADLFQGISDARNGADSNHSVTSTCTEPMDEGNGNDSHPQSPTTENHVAPTSFAQVLVKQEMGMPEVDECLSPLNAINITAQSNNHVENSSENNVAMPTINDQVKKEQVENNENSRDISIQNMTDAAINVKTEPIENHEDATVLENTNHEDATVLQNTNHEDARVLENENDEKATQSKNKNKEKLPTKRKPHLDAKLEQIRKRLKKEPSEDDENETINFSFEQDNETQREDIPLVPLNHINICGQVRNDNESAGDAIKEIIDNDIAVLTVPKIKKNIELITLSDDDDDDHHQNSEEQDIEMDLNDIETISTSLPTNIPNIHCNVPVQPSAESPSTSTQLTKERNFSTDILSLFSVASELDRYDCQTCLNSLRKKKINNSLTNFFPSVKMERKATDPILRGDMLFKRTTIKKHFDAKRTPISQNDSSIPPNLPVQSTAQSVTGRLPELFSSNLLPVETCSTQNRAQISQNVDYNSPEKLQPTVNFSGLPPSQSAMFSHNLFPTPTSSNFEVNPSPNSWSATSVPSNSNITHMLDQIKDFLKNREKDLIDNLSKRGAASDQHQSTKTTTISPQAPLGDGASQTIAPLPNRTFQTPSYSATTTFAASGSSSSVSTTSYVPAVPCMSAVSSRSQETHDSRHAVNKPLTSKIESSIQNRNTAVVQPQVSFQPVEKQFSTTLPPTTFQSLPGHSISINASRPSLGTRDPRTPANRVTRTEFRPRKGNKNLSLYLNIGKDHITQHFDDLILQWNPDWMRLQQKTSILPPISETYKSVVYFYSNEMDYYNTYVPLHLLNIWFNIFHCWAHDQYTVVNKCIVQSVEILDNGFKISISAILENTEGLPKNDDIVLYKEEAFLRVEDVKRKPLGHGLKLRMTLRTLHNLHLNLDDEVSFKILWNTRAAYLQTEALNSLDNSMKELVLKPTDLLNRIEIVQLIHTKKSKEQRDDILKVVMLPQIRVVMVETYYGHDSVLLLTQVAFNILLNFNVVFSEKFSSRNLATTKKQSKVLIILKNDQLLEKLYKSLSQYKPILAVRTKQINLSPGLVKYTIEDRLEKNASEERLETKECINKIVQEHHIFLTTVSAFGSTEKNLLSKMKDLICIIDDAHQCTEVETALPLTLKISKLLLIGNKERRPNLPEALLEYKYHITLFVRLLKAKRRL